MAAYPQESPSPKPSFKQAISMHSLIRGLIALTSIITPTLALPTAVSSVSTIFQFEQNGTWLENLAVRPNGNILATRLDAPELWQINPTKPKSNSGSLLYTFPNATGLLGITPIAQDIFAVIAGNVSLQTVTGIPDSYAVWRLDLSTPQPTANILARIPEAVFPNGIVHFTKDIVLITDSAKGLIWRLRLSTGEFTPALSDPTMVPAPGQPTIIGVNGIDVRGKYVYFTSTTQMLLARVPVDKQARATGPVEVVASGFTPDDLMVTGNGTAYVSTNPQNGVLRIDPHGRVRLVAGNEFRVDVAGATAVAGNQDASVLYVTTGGGQFRPVLGRTVEPAKVVAVRLGV
ncbi:hypothetical protein BDV28DRAFT_145366 [Aspergillus coremiiformis]|uniref:SMP-30/Gluconolactonase/LRE-like region domain-containing protein n=1 Tax=Aspergillus coremiiformis TaxID=138285 RepID=A0A5N6ZET8_9EURO|nr:hypothetical protein BDV28DRAFT_145366 [Aspergillus coremiiformis]